ncbi:MAG: NYN domain-containing protein [Chloroflexi bacterium]|nr:NYN domain-containing protein [Chloroflexota bacterium]
MALKTVIFIDGQNFKKNLQEFSFKSEKPNVRYPLYTLDEKHFEWNKFFRRVIEKFNEQTHLKHTLMRAYWYNAETITPFQKNDSWIRSILTKYGTEFPELDASQVESLARHWWERERDNFGVTRSTVFEEIQRRTDFLEFKYVGQYVVRPFDPYRIAKDANGKIVYQGRRVGEKGVDVGIAVDMITKAPMYDAGVLISGDVDYMPAVTHIKDQLRYFYQFSLAKGIPPRIHHLSPWLRGGVDCFASFDELTLLQEFLRRNDIPPYILDEIDNRINALISQVPQDPTC